MSRRLRKLLADLKCRLGLHHVMTYRNIKTGWEVSWCDSSNRCNGRLLRLSHSHAERVPEWLRGNWPAAVPVGIVTDHGRAL